MTVYIVKGQHSNTDDPFVKAIFSTEELAKVYAEQEKPKYYYGVWIEEYVLNSGDGI